ncbi:DNA topoisomerase IV subunit A, partial [mine drainage metagenome]
EDPESSTAALMRHVKGPDLPTGAEIISPRSELKEIYETGVGSFKARATYEIEDGSVVITVFSYQVSPTRVQEQIAEQMRAKKLPMLEDVRDESDHEHPVRLVLVPRSSRVDLVEVMNHLFATTDLERNYRVNLNIIGSDAGRACSALWPSSA